MLASAAWQVSTRRGVTIGFSPLELAMMRYVVPGVIMGLVLGWRTWKPQGLSWCRLGTIVVGGGAPFGFLVAMGARYAPAAHLSIFLAGTIPLLTACGGWVVYREKLSGGRVAGLVSIFMGIVTLVISADASVLAVGDVAFLLAATGAAAYTLAYRRSGLPPITGLLLVNVWSALMLLPCLVQVDLARVLSAPKGELLLQLAAQMVLGGLLGPLMYLITIKYLGSSRAALTSALPPVIAGIGGQLLLGEPLTDALVAAMLVVVAGVILASGAVATTTKPP